MQAGDTVIKRKEGGGEELGRSKVLRTLGGHKGPPAFSGNPFRTAHLKASFFSDRNVAQEPKHLSLASSFSSSPAPQRGKKEEISSAAAAVKQSKLQARSAQVCQTQSVSPLLLPLFFFFHCCVAATHRQRWSGGVRRAWGGGVFFSSTTTTAPPIGSSSSW